MTVEVKIRGIVSTQRYGTLETGDILRTDEAYGAFLVDECQAGEYVIPAADENKQEEQPKAAPKRARKTKEIPQ